MIMANSIIIQAGRKEKIMDIPKEIENDVEMICETMDNCEDLNEWLENGNTFTIEIHKDHFKFSKGKENAYAKV